MLILPEYSTSIINIIIPGTDFRSWRLLIHLDMSIARYTCHSPPQNRISLNPPSPLRGVATGLTYAVRILTRRGRGEESLALSPRINLRPSDSRSWPPKSIPIRMYIGSRASAVGMRARTAFPFLINVPAISFLFFFFFFTSTISLTRNLGKFASMYPVPDERLIGSESEKSSRSLR